MIRAGIVGGSGYVGGEMIRLLLNHPYCEIVFVQSQSQQGLKVSQIHPDLRGQTSLSFSSHASMECDVLFLCGGHGRSHPFLSENQYDDITIVDLSRDFRIAAEHHNFTYGLCELNRNAISQSSRVANPGCFATCIQLALLPLANHHLLSDEIHVTAITGATGAGQKPIPTTHFSWRDNNLSIYKPFVHQHLDEIIQGIQQLQPGFDQAINFIPVRGNFSRGILASIYLDFKQDIETAYHIFTEYYDASPFVHLSQDDISLKEVVNTNNCFLQLGKHGDKLHIIAVIDNLIKGAAGQAIQNMNLIFARPEDEGLKLKASFF